MPCLYFQVTSEGIKIKFVDAWFLQNYIDDIHFQGFKEDMGRISYSLWFVSSKYNKRNSSQHFYKL